MASQADEAEREGEWEDEMGSGQQSPDPVTDTCWGREDAELQTREVCGPGPGSCWSTVPGPKTAGRPRQGPVLLAARPGLPETGHGLPARMCVPRKQEELVQQVRKRLEEALMADMLAHVEELARDGEAPLDKPGADEDDEDEDEDEEPDQDADMEHI